MFFTRIITIHRVLFGQQKVNGVLREHGRDWKKKRYYYDALGFCLGCLTTAVCLNYFETKCCNRRHEKIMKRVREQHAVLRVNERELETPGDGVAA